MPVKTELARNVLKKAKTVSDEAEVYLNTSRQLKIDVLNGKIESIDNVTEGGVALRLIKNKRMGFAYTADFAEDAADDLVEAAVNNMQDSPVDELMSFPEPKSQGKKMSLVDEAIDSTKLADKKTLALEIEKAAYAYDPRVKKGEKISYQDTYSETAIANSKGVNVYYDKAVCGAFAEVIAQKDNLMETGSWFKYSAKIKDIDPAYIGREAAKRAVEMLGAVVAKSGKAPIVLTPYAGAIILSAISTALSAEFVQKGKSVFKNALSKPVGSSRLNIMDSGLLDGGISSAPYDDEGTPARETVIVSGGILKSYLYDNYTALKGKVPSTGNAVRSSFKSPPDISPTNLYFAAGSKPQEELMSGISKGFLVHTIMGAHTINPISGDFSIGFAGFLIENGKLSIPVRGMTIAGNLLEVLSNIDDIGSDLMFFPQSGNIGSPSLLLSNLSVSGS